MAGGFTGLNVEIVDYDLKFGKLLKPWGIRNLEVTNCDLKWGR